MSFKETAKEIKLYKTILENYSDKSAFMKKAAEFYLVTLNNRKTEIKDINQYCSEDDDTDGIMGILDK